MNIFFNFFQIFFVWIVCIVFFIGFQVCIALAVYYDGQSKMNRNSVVWAVLCGLLGIIPMIIYLCVRNNPSTVPIYCSQCGRAHFISEPCCPFCHQENPYSRIEVANPRTQEQHKRAKVCLIIGICLLAAGILAMVIALVALFYNVLGAISYYN